MRYTFVGNQYTDCNLNASVTFRDWESSSRDKQDIFLYIRDIDRLHQR